MDAQTLTATEAIEAGLEARDGVLVERQCLVNALLQ